MYDPSRVCLTPSAVEARANVIRNDPERAALMWLNLELFVRQLSEDIALLQQLAGVPR
jgi:hypothetical protein